MEPTKAPAPYLRVSDVMEEVCVSRRTVTRWLASGRLRYVKLGPSKQSGVRVPRGALEEFLDAGEPLEDDRGG